MADEMKLNKYFATGALLVGLMVGSVNAKTSNKPVVYIDKMIDRERVIYYHDNSSKPDVLKIYGFDPMYNTKQSISIYNDYDKDGILFNNEKDSFVAMHDPSENGFSLSDLQPDFSIVQPPSIENDVERKSKDERKYGVVIHVIRDRAVYAHQHDSFKIISELPVENFLKYENDIYVLYKKEVLKVEKK